MSDTPAEWEAKALEVAHGIKPHTPTVKAQAAVLGAMNWAAVCHAPGVMCLGCDHYKRLSAVCDYAPAPAPTPTPQRVLTDAARDVLAERRRQISVEGWTPEHDDQHNGGAMAIAAAAYALSAHGELSGPASDQWARTGWGWAWFKPKGKRADLIRAGALILAEIERLDRAAVLAAQEKTK